MMRKNINENPPPFAAGLFNLNSIASGGGEQQQFYDPTLWATRP
jgi:hypothetical protein